MFIFLTLASNGVTSWAGERIVGVSRGDSIENTILMNVWINKKSKYPIEEVSLKQR